MHATRSLRLGVLFTLVVGRGAIAGGQLTPALLVKDADAIAIVDNPLHSSLAVRRWLTAEPTTPVELSSPLCVPDRDMLKSWTKTHAKNDGASIWAKTLAVGHMDQVVFLKNQKGRLVPFCETEVLQGRSFSTHPEYKAFVAEVEALIAAAAPPPAAVVEPVAVEPAAVVEPVAAVVVDKGCW